MNMTSPVGVVSAIATPRGAARRVYLVCPRIPSSRPGIALLPSLALAIALVGASCKNINSFTLEEDIKLGQQAYVEATKDEAILRFGPEVAQVQRVTERLTRSALEMKPHTARHFDWEVVVIDDPNTVNAFCLPGGKMAVYTGILAVAQDDAGLAVVMGHEIAHATERHGTERLTRNGLLNSGITVLLEHEDEQQAASVISNYVIGMPWGRTDELEADHEGLMIMANAGYDPREAPEFWERMAAASSGDSAPGHSILAASSIDEFLSTHPSNQRRIDQLKAAIPAALLLYEAAKDGIH